MPKLLFEINPLAVMSDERLVRSMDLAGPTPAASFFLKRLRSFGFTEIIASIETVEPSWATSADVQMAVEAAKAFLTRENTPYFISQRYVAPTCDLLAFYDNCSKNALAYNAQLYENLPGEDDDVYFVMSMRSLFIPKDEMEALLPALQNPAILTCYRHTWEGLYAAKKSYFRESSIKDIWSSSHVVIKDVAYALPVSHPAFDLTLEYRPLLDELPSSPDKWSYHDLEVLKKEKPQLFRSLPGHIGVELTNEDNLPRLRHPGKLSNRPLGRLSEEDWGQLLNGLRTDMKRMSLDFWDFGEPLMHPLSLEFILQAAQKGVRVDLYTNGLLLNQDNVKQLVDSGADAVFFRLDSATAETYEKVSGQLESYDLAMKNLRALAAFKKSRRMGSSTWHAWRPLIAVQITEMPETAADVEEFFLRYDVSTRIRKQLHTDLGRPPREPEVYQALYAKEDPIEYAMLRHDNLFRGRVTRGDEQDMSPLFRFPCRQLLEGPYVIWTGEILPCREDVDGEHVVGHVREGVVPVWQGEKMSAFFQLHDKGEWGRSALCGNCKEWYYGFS